MALLPLEHQPYLDTKEGLERIRGNKQVYKRLLDIFFQKNFIAQFKDELKNGDLSAAAQTAHSIKGTAGNLSMPALYQASIVLDKKLKAGEVIDAASLAEYEAIMANTLLAAQEALHMLANGDEI